MNPPMMLPAIAAGVAAFLGRRTTMIVLGVSAVAWIGFSKVSHIVHDRALIQESERIDPGYFQIKPHTP